MPQESSASNTWRTLSSDDFANAIHRAGASVVTVHARRRIPSSGVHWRAGIIVTADHTVERDEDITVTLPDGRNVPATLAGRDSTTDFATLKIDAGDLALAEKSDAATLKAGNLILAAGRTAEGAVRASSALVGVTGPAMRTWQGGQLDLTVRLDRRLHPNLSRRAGGRRARPGVRNKYIRTFPAGVTCDSCVDGGPGERGAGEKRPHGPRVFGSWHAARAAFDQTSRMKLKISNEFGVMVASVEPDGPAEKAGAMLGDVLVALDGKPLNGLRSVQSFLIGAQVGTAVKASIIRGGALIEVVVTIGERPAAK